MTQREEFRKTFGMDPVYRMPELPPERGLLVTAAHEAFDRYYAVGDAAEGAFIDGARWFAAGMAVCAFLEDLAALAGPPSPLSADAENMLNQIDAFSCAMRRSWGGK